MDPLFRWIRNGALLAAALLIGGFVVAGWAGLLGFAVYLCAIVLPGGFVYALLANRLRPEKPRLIEAVFYSHLLGLGLVIGAGWTLARWGAFSLAGTFLLEALVVALVGVGGRREFSAITRTLREGGISLDRECLAYLGIVVGLATAVIIPVLIVQSHGFLVADDTAVFARAANALLRTGDWTKAVQIFPFLPPAAANTAFGNPAISILYAVFAGSAGVNAIYVAGPLYTLLLVLPTLGLYLLVGRFTKHPLLTYALPVLWMLGFWSDKAIFFNNSLVASYYGIIPDAVLSLTGYVAVLVLLTDLLRGTGKQSYELSLLSVGLFLGIMGDPLTFVLIAIAFVFFGIWMLHARGVRWSIPRLLAPLVLTAVLLPPYLVPSYAVGASNGLSGGMHLTWRTLLIYNWTGMEGFYDSLDLFGVVLSVFAVAKVLLSKIPLRGRKPFSYHVEGILPFGLLTAAGLYLVFNPLVASLLGVTFGRFVEYVGISMVPLVAFGLDRLLRPRVPRPRLGKVAAVLVVILIGTCGAVSVQQNLQSAAMASQTQSLFNADMMAAAEWLQAHGTPGSTVVVDSMAGNQAPLPMQDFADLTFMYRPQYDLYNSIYNPPIPSVGNPYFFLNRAIEYPTQTNVTAAWQVFAMKYYVFQVGYSDTEIQVFSHLPYVQRVYSNAVVEVFGYTGGSAPGFVPAISYFDASPNLTTAYFGSAYSVAYGLPHVPNSVQSLTTDGAVDGSFLSYGLKNISAGNYSLTVHRYTYQTSEYLKVSVNGAYVGSVDFLALGPNFSTSVSFPLVSGNDTVTLTLEGTVGYMDPIDFFVVS
ncbi:MAG: hypothetical protein M1144_05525 [Candidatus Thermoplasmatota archaeon]|jgi:hypothetical protein|nr:hypothetical protein [Candidatus Thermoplasmatota archaeon]MCL5984619.1 hypothetical protein [Candidatus Thermoplasmatota archaeon]